MDFELKRVHFAWWFIVFNAASKVASDGAFANRDGDQNEIDGISAGVFVFVKTAMCWKWAPGREICTVQYICVCICIYSFCFGQEPIRLSVLKNAILFAVNMVHLLSIYISIWVYFFLSSSSSFLSLSYFKVKVLINIFIFFWISATHFCTIPFS